MMSLMFPSVPQMEDTDLSQAQSLRGLTCTTLMSRPVSEESCSLTCRAGFGEFLYAFFSVSSCFAVMVVRGRLAPVSESSAVKTTLMESAELKQLGLLCPPSFPETTSGEEQAVSWRSTLHTGTLTLTLVNRLS